MDPMSKHILLGKMRRWYKIYRVRDRGGIPAAWQGI